VRTDAALTCIALARVRGRIAIGGDSAVTDSGGLLYRTALPKVWRAGSGGFVIGAAGGTEFDTMLRFRVAWPDKCSDPVRHVVSELPQALRQLARDDGAELPDGEALIVHGGRVFELASAPSDDDGPGRVEVTPIAEPYAALGSGGDLALGFLSGTRLGDARARVAQALRVSARHHSGVCGPFTVLNV
jgi:ATP-dependent protease HslVU (ClpYQ) peptidase subunit